jgi:hypothetical protein
MLAQHLALQPAAGAKRQVCPTGHRRVKIAAVSVNVAVPDEDQPGRLDERRSDS